MADTKLYTVRLVAGFPAENRHRAGVYLERGQRLTTELTKEQVEALEADDWISLKLAEDQNDEESNEIVLKDLKRDDLNLIASELGLDPSDYSNKEAIVAAIEAKKAEAPVVPPAGDDNHEEEEELPALDEKTVDELVAIANELKLEVPVVEDEAAYKAALIEAIVAAKPVEE